MKTKFFTSAMVMSLVAVPAFAAATEQSVFPEYMQPNTIYLGAATSTNMADVDGTEGNDIVNGVAQYDSCPVGYPNTDSGATLLDQCYHECSAADVPHAANSATISGKYYRGSQSNGYAAINACVPSACEAGYLNVNVDFKTAFSNPAGAAWAAQEQDGYSSEGATGSASSSGLYTANDDWHGPGNWLVRFSANNGGAITNTGELIGSSFCTSETNVTVGAPNPNGGTNCYCYITGYRQSLVGEILPAQSLRVFLGNEGNIYSANGGRGCEKNCAASCAAAVAGASYPEFANRDLLLSYASITNKCVKNNNDITILWDGVAVGVNNTVVTNGITNSVVKYGSDVQTPAVPLSVSGKIFKGWQFSKPTGATPVICPQTNIATLEPGHDPDEVVNPTANTIQLVAPAGATSVNSCRCPAGFENKYSSKGANGTFTGTIISNQSVDYLVCYVDSYNPVNY